MARKRGANEGSIFQRKDRRWCGIVDLGWENGKRKRKSIYGQTRKQVAKELNKALREKEQGLPVAVERQTVGQFLEHWLENSVKLSTRPATFASYADTVNLHLSPELGRFPLLKLAPQHVQALMNRKLRCGLSPRYVAYIRAVLRIALNQAKKWNLIVTNAADLVQPPRIERYEIKTLDPVNSRNLLDAAKGERLEALYSVALSLGLRRGEILALRWHDVDLQGGTLSVRQAAQRVRGRGITFAPPKTDRARRTIVIASPLVSTLREHRKRQLQERLKAGSEWRDNDLVFASRVGTPIEPRNLDRHFKRTLTKAGLPDMRFHDLRHSAASLLLAQNVNPRVVMEILGHSRIGMTLDTYSHVMPAAMREAADKISSVLWEENQMTDSGEQNSPRVAVTQAVRSLQALGASSETP